MLRKRKVIKELNNKNYSKDIAGKTCRKKSELSTLKVSGEASKEIHHNSLIITLVSIFKTKHRQINLQTDNMDRGKTYRFRPNLKKPRILCKDLS